MKRDTKKDLKIVGDIYPELVQLQVEDYCPTAYRIIIVNSRQLTEKDKEE
jgi:hypothetical protein